MKLRNYKALFPNIVIQIFVIFVVLSCIPMDQVRLSGATQDQKSPSNGGTNGGLNSTVPSDNDVDVSDEDDTIYGEPELRHIVDPLDSAYKTKVTIPKNFSGYLYLSGVNIKALKNKIVHARFNFGREYESVVIPATIGRASGLTPQLDIDVVILRMNNKPFSKIKLLYDLFDYTSYSNDDEPVQDNRGDNLYCRGLKLEYDPTFISSSSNSACDAAGETCLYAYAKIGDKGLVEEADPTKIIIPTLPNIDPTNDGESYEDSMTDEYALQMCLPDNLSVDDFEDVLGGVSSTTNSGNVLFGSTKVTLDGKSYVYMGPYRTYDQNNWEISGGAIFSDSSNKGLFEQSMYNSDAIGGYKSFLFPRGGKVELNDNIQYYGSSDKFNGSLSLDYLQVSGTTTKYLHGCSLRAMEMNQTTLEGIQSCNVTATIELITLDPLTNKTTIITSSNDVKLQLVRESITNSVGQEINASSLKSCNSSSACSKDECCYNNRCWSKSIVSQCIETTGTDVFNLPLGTSCTSDYQCASLCCDSSRSVCNIGENGELCGKIPGQSCVANDWCKIETVSECKIYRTNVLNDEQVEICELRCLPVEKHGDCINGVCTPPSSSAPPVFDVNAPECTNYPTVYDPPTASD